MNNTIKYLSRFKLGISLILTGCLSVPALVFAQPPMVTVPPEVAMDRPTPAELEKTQQALDGFLAKADSDTKSILAKFPDLLRVRVPGFNTATFPNLSINFLAKHQANLEVAQKGNIDVLFMGDSITDLWRSDREPMAGKPVFDKYFGDWKVANFGIAGDTTQGVLYRLQHGEGEGFSPKVIMLLIGVNNTRSNTAPEIAEGAGAVVAELQKHFPAAEILLLGIFPTRAANDPIRQDIAYINKVISRLDHGDKVHYLDIGHVFLDADGNIPKEIMNDSLHPTTAGYELWAQAVIKPLSDLLNK